MQLAFTANLDTVPLYTLFIKIFSHLVGMNKCHQFNESESQGTEQSMFSFPSTFLCEDTR